MHHSILSFFLLLLFSVTLHVYGQEISPSSEPIIYKGQIAISPSLGIRGPGSTITNSKAGNVTIPAVLYIDYGLNEMLSVGLIGGLRHFRCESCSENVNGTFYSLGVRVNAHVLPVLKQVADIDIQQEKLDIYLSLMGGAELNSSIRMIPRFSLGARYRVLPNISVMGELGSGFLSMGNVGLSFHL